MKLNYSLIAATLLFSLTIISCSESKKPVLRHVVAFTFKQEITPERQEQAIKDFMALKDQVPGIISFEGGKDVSVEGFTKDLTHCFTVTFKDKESRDNYIPHPAHLALVDKNKPLMTDLLVLDYWGEE
ncbi:Dabb family protein [Reichenbachiella versicolor]|uniref:Dabb family protein n=1 Tax=Reichenbachiella versicolor TaxID=1821036 RepID=UPI000D6E9CCD|nr:Dabb family protein [Reichenbachiella versicolor]